MRKYTGRITKDTIMFGERNRKNKWTLYWNWPQDKPTLAIFSGHCVLDLNCRERTSGCAHQAESSEEEKSLKETGDAVRKESRCQASTRPSGCPPMGGLVWAQ